MLRDGPIPPIVHGAVEYAAGVFLIAAPFVLDYDSGAAVAASIVMGLAILAVTATSVLPTGLVMAITSGVHVTVDYVSVALFVALPFVLGFRDETLPTTVFIALGVAHLLLTIGTRFPTGSPDEVSPPASP